ncbi:MAG: hypothetical protein HOI35_12000 [Woeseia sp.]|nr:hypothetical protein [Woeseia sp.]
MTALTGYIRMGTVENKASTEVVEWRLGTYNIRCDRQTDGYNYCEK